MSSNERNFSFYPPPPHTSNSQFSSDNQSVRGLAPFSSILTSSPPPPSPTMGPISSSSLASTATIQNPQVNSSSLEGHIIPIMGPHASATSGLPDFQRKGFKSSISGRNLVRDLRRGLSVSVVHKGRKGMMKPLPSGMATSQPKSMAKTGHLNQFHIRNDLAVCEESDCVDTDGETSLMGTKDPNPHGWRGVDSNVVDFEVDPSYEHRLRRNRKGRRTPATGVSSKLLAACTFSNTLSWMNQKETNTDPLNKKASQPTTTATWFRGRSLEKDKEKESSKARERSLDLRWNRRRDGMVFTHEELEDEVSAEPIRRVSSLKMSKNNRLAVRKMSLPETGMQTAVFQTDRDKIAPWERMGEEKSREGWCVKAINALNLDVWPSIHSKSLHSSGAPSTTSVSQPDSASGVCPLPLDSEVVIHGTALTTGEAQDTDESPGHSPIQAWLSSSSDEADDEEFVLEGLRPRPIAGDERLNKYWELVKEQRWAEAKLVCELGIVFDSKVKKPVKPKETLKFRNHPLLSVMQESSLSAAITFQPARNFFHHSLFQSQCGKNGQATSTLSLWLAVQAHLAAREYLNLLSQEIREAAIQQGLVRRDQLKNGGESMIDKIGTSAWRKLASVEWKQYVDDAAERVITNVNTHIREVGESMLLQRPLRHGLSSRDHKKLDPKASMFPDSFFIIDENDDLQFRSVGFPHSSTGPVSKNWWEYLATDIGAILEFRMPTNPHPSREPKSRVVRFGKLEPYMVNQTNQGQTGSYHLLTMCPLVLRNGSKVVRKNIGALLNVTTLVRFSVIDRILGTVEGVTDTEQVQCQDAAITKTLSKEKELHTLAAFKKLRGLDGAVRMEGDSSIHIDQSNNSSGSSFQALCEFVSGGKVVFDQSMLIDSGMTHPTVTWVSSAAEDTLQQARGRSIFDWIKGYRIRSMDEKGPIRSAEVAIKHLERGFCSRMKFDMDVDAEWDSARGRVKKLLKFVPLASVAAQGEDFSQWLCFLAAEG